MAFVLLVEDNQRVAESIARALTRHAEVRRVATIREALSELRATGREWLAAVVDIGLPDGSGLDLARRLLSDPYRLPTLVITGAEERHLANDAHASGAQFAFKPVRVADVDAFMCRVLENRPTVRIAAALDALAVSAELSPREKEILRLAIDGIARGSLTERLDIENSTLKTQIRSILRKTECTDLDAVVRKILEAAVKR